MKGSTWSPGPNASQLQNLYHHATDVMKPVKSGGWVEPKWRGQLPFPSGFILPSWDQENYWRAYGSGIRRDKGHPNKERVLGAGRLRG